MATCEQSSGQTILQHGESVARTYKEAFILEQVNVFLPCIIRENLNWLKGMCPADEIMEEYHLFHDCGKPSCLHIDAEGKRHFPGHAMASAREYLVAGGDALIGRLIERDMDMHITKAADALTYKHLSLAPALLLTAWAELNANSLMFGGIESISFKIKSKALTKLSKAIITILKDQS